MLLEFLLINVISYNCLLSMYTSCYAVLLVFFCVSALWLLVLFPIIGIILLSCNYLCIELNGFWYCTCT